MACDVITHVATLIARVCRLRRPGGMMLICEGREHLVDIAFSQVGMHTKYSIQLIVYTVAVMDA